VLRAAGETGKPCKKISKIGLSWMKGKDPGFQLLTEEEETVANVIQDSAMKEEANNGLQESIPCICFLRFFFVFYS
jgi:hypothetical protein